MKNFTWRILTREALCDLYQNEMTRDFPPDELRPLAMILALYDTERYIPHGVFDETGKLCAYLNVVHALGTKVAFLDYFATTPELRGAGLGLACLNTLCEMETAQGLTAILWEAETPEFAPDPEMATRRMGFYKRAGGQDTTLRNRVYGVWFDILYHPCTGSLTPFEAEKGLLCTYRQLMTPKDFGMQFLLKRMGK